MAKIDVTKCDMCDVTTPNPPPKAWGTVVFKQNDDFAIASKLELDLCERCLGRKRREMHDEARTRAEPRREAS